MDRLRKARQLMQHRNVKAIQTWEELGKSCQGKGGHERVNWEDHLENSLVCSEGAEICVLKTSVLFQCLSEKLETCSLLHR